LPRGFPTWETVYCWFRRLSIDGTWERLNAALRELSRVRLGRDPEPKEGKKVDWQEFMPPRASRSCPAGGWWSALSPGRVRTEG